MYRILGVAVLFFGLAEIAHGQGKFVEKDGEASFFSSAPLEDIEALNKKVQSVIDMSTKEIVIVIPIKEFIFDKSLMQEHFNENYLESDKYPKATFKGSFTSAKEIDLNQEGLYPVVVSGNLTIHGVTQELTTNGTIKVEKETLFANTKFDIRIEDYKIKIPKMVFKNIAEVVEVESSLTYDPL